MFEDNTVICFVYIYLLKFVYFFVALNFSIISAIYFFHLVKRVSSVSAALMMVLYTVIISMLKPSSSLSFFSSKVRSAL